VELEENILFDTNTDGRIWEIDAFSSGVSMSFFFLGSEKEREQGSDHLLFSREKDTCIPDRLWGWKV